MDRVVRQSQEDIYGVKKSNDGETYIARETESDFNEVYADFLGSNSYRGHNNC
jgi:hypothetical protein